MFTWAIGAVSMYQECQSRHQRLVEAVDEAPSDKKR